MAEAGDATRSSRVRGAGRVRGARNWSKMGGPSTWRNATVLRSFLLAAGMIFATGCP